MHAGDWFYDPRPSIPYNYFELLSDGDAEEIEISTFTFDATTRNLKGPRRTTIAVEELRKLTIAGEVASLARDEVPFLLEM